ncbi:hydroxymethylglutaryl-CoA lyase [Bacillus suaedaesalsae]|uniref:Hydroxymethylglutaryl-CoA lyase n=1 Tax=Bacillus suaedaesalsae TaxID=2810349 RepID=A0ABS2DNA7_9BACI|nr:hydroxymethylglutaryl-CoA lyase [Bacillus suaedaesalsae]
MNLPKHATIIEVGPRDGLQNDKSLVPTDVKIEFIHALKASGINEIELTSFVSPKWVPQMKDAKEIVAAVQDSSRNIVLAPNRKGVDMALESNCMAVAVFVGVSDTFNKKNINKTTSESLLELQPVIKELKDKDIFVRACISTSFYCPYEGKMNVEDVVNLCSSFVEYGVDELSVADTIGMANPKESYELFSRLKEEFPDTLVTAHFHDTRGMALANVFAALQAGISRFDTSAGGLGGCPFAKGATGNVATEDVVFMLHQMGIETGIDLEGIKKAVDIIRPHISRHIESKYDRLVQASQ